MRLERRAGDTLYVANALTGRAASTISPSRTNRAMSGTSTTSPMAGNGTERRRCQRIRCDRRVTHYHGADGGRKLELQDQRFIRGGRLSQRTALDVTASSNSELLSPFSSGRMEPRQTSGVRLAVAGRPGSALGGTSNDSANSNDPSNHQFLRGPASRRRHRGEEYRKGACGVAGSYAARLPPTRW